MKHLPYETWLLSEEMLSPEQARALEAHLQSCARCRELTGAWSAVRQLFANDGPARPAAGFARRWRERLASERIQERRLRERRQSLRFLGLSAGVAALLLLMMAIQLLATVETPTQLLIGWLSQVTSFLSFANAVQEVSFTLLAVLLGAVPPLWLATMGAALGLLCLLWIVSLRKVMLPWRITL